MLRFKTGTGWMCVAIAAVAVGAVAPAYGADRMVLGEYFNATW